MSLAEKIAISDVDEFLNWINTDHIRHIPMGKSQLAKKIGLSRVAMYNIFSGNADPKLSTVIKICRALNVELHAVKKATEDTASVNPALRPKKVW